MGQKPQGPVVGEALTVHTRSGTVDLVAVRRWVAGDDDVPLTDVERDAAICAAARAGCSKAQIVTRLGCRHSIVNAALAAGDPADRSHTPIQINT